MRQLYLITFTVEVNNRKHAYTAELFKSERDDAQKFLTEAQGVTEWNIERVDVIWNDELQEAFREDIP